MYNSALPVEILESIIEEIILHYKDAPSSMSRGIKFLPQWYLTPLLRVCKLWHVVSERFLYQSISVGRKFTRGKTRRIGGRWEVLPPREGSEIAKELLEALLANPRLPALIEELQLGVEGASSFRSVGWTQTNARILHICTNLKQVKIRGFHPSQMDALTEVLKEKSLVSFCISPRDIDAPDLMSPDFRDGVSLKLLELMQGWPKIQAINIEGFPKFRERGQLSDDLASGASNCCPELREIIFTDGFLRDGHLDGLRSACSGVTKLMVPVYRTSDSDAVLDALCGCLRAWSPTLECFRLHIWTLDLPYRPLSQVLSSLWRLEELQIHKFEVDFDAISNLPQLKRLRYTSIFADEALGRLASQLENPVKFPALRHIATYANGSGRGERRLKDLSRKRNIELQLWDGRSPLSGFLL